MTELEKIRDFFKADRYAMFSGMQIDHVKDGQSVCSMEIQDMHKNAGNTVMGGAIFTLADFAFAVAANAAYVCGKGRLTVSLSSNISFLRPPKGSRLVASAIPVDLHEKICFYRVIVVDNAETMVADVTITGYIR